MRTIERLEIHELFFPVDGYKFNVQIWRSVDGNNWYYCGDGKYFRTIEEVLNFQSDWVKINKEG